MVSKIRNKVILPIYYQLNKNKTLVHLERLKKTQWASRDYLEHESWMRVKAVLKHAYTNCPYYTNLFKSIDAVPEDIKDPSDYEKIPVLTKALLQNNLEDLVATNLPREAIHKDATGGSTGNHTPFYRDNQCLEIKKAAELRFDTWTGCGPGDRRAFYWPALQDLGAVDTLRSRLRQKLINPQIMLYAGIMDEKNLEAHFRALKKYQPMLIRAFPNPLSVFSKYLLDHNKTISPAEGIICVGEPLLPSQRELFEKVFGCQVYNCYVSRECGNMACECELHEHLHLNLELHYMEFLSGSQDSNAPGKIIITDLHNYGMPFIRYQIEDMGRKIDKPCDCGRNLPLIEIGACRTSDFVVSPVDNSFISGSSVLHYLIAEGPQVGQIQIVQDKLDHLLIKIKKSQGFSEDKLTHFDNVMMRFFKGRMHFDIEYVETIDREKSGKYRFIISKIAQ